MQFPQLFSVDRRGRARHQIDGVGRLREGDDFANGGFAGQQRDDPVEPERDAAVRGRAVLERLQEEPEARAPPRRC